MSMNTYAAIDNGLLLTQEVAVWVILAHNKKSEGLTPEALEFVNSGRFAELAKDDFDEVPDELCKALGFDSLEFIELYELASDCLEEFQEDCIHYSRFEGSATSLTFPEEKDAIPNEWNFNGNDLWYIPLWKGPSLFAEQVYASGDDIVEEMKERMREILPENFDYRSAHVSIDGTTFC